MKKKLYKLHRILSLVIAAPVLLWALSGFMHPLMTNIRPKIATQVLAPLEIDSTKLTVSLQNALRVNHIDSFFRVRLVHIDTNWFYQVQSVPDKEPVYLATRTGKTLTAGDWLYAQYIARQFLEGQAGETGKQLTVSSTASGVHDCCDAATDCVLNPVKGAKVKDVSLVNAFNSEYKKINCLLPVQRVSFDREDGIRIYVETTQDRFAFAMDNKRSVFDRIFTLVHTWGWLDFLGRGKLVVELVLVMMVFTTTLFGVYIFFTTKSKKAAGNGLVKARRLHRYTSISIALFTLMFTFSGAYHAFDKLREDPEEQHFVSRAFKAAGINYNFNTLQNLVKAPVINTGLVWINEKAYWQVTTKNTNVDVGNDLMKDSKRTAPDVVYISTDSLQELPNGEETYARYMALEFSGNAPETVTAATQTFAFTNEYNFTDKRLPVWRIAYATNGNERYYVETATGKLAKYVNNGSLAESYSFAFFHKHEFMMWGGKQLKDFSTMFWALAQVLMVVIGLRLYLKYRKK